MDKAQPREFTAKSNVLAISFISCETASEHQSSTLFSTSQRTSRRPLLQLQQTFARPHCLYENILPASMGHRFLNKTICSLDID